MIALISIEGANGDARDPSSGYTGSFVHEKFRHWPHPKLARYLAGPAPPNPISRSPYASVNAVADAAVREAYHLVKVSKARGLFLIAYSLGAASTIVAARRLKQFGIEVDCLALYDGVDAWPPTLQAGWAPTNVKYLVHGYRNVTANSRPLWGNCATSSLFSPADFLTPKITHWGASGVPLQEGIPPGQSGTDIIDETGLLGETRQTNVTWNEDMAAAQQLKKFMDEKINNAYVDCLVQFRDPSKIPPGNGAPGNGAPGGGGAAPGAGSYLVQQGDSLSLIAGKLWQDILLWPLLYDQNKSKIGANPNLIQPNMSLVIPEIGGYSPSQLESVRQRGRTEWQ